MSIQVAAVLRVLCLGCLAAAGAAWAGGSGAGEPIVSLVEPNPMPKPAPAPHPALQRIKRIYVDRFTGGETAAQMRDMIISALHASGLFEITENEERADAILRGSAEDLVFTDVYQSSDGVSARISFSASNPVDRRYATGRDSRSSGASVNLDESQRIQERKHEASASVRLINKDGDVIWATIQESMGAKFRSASADVALKVSRQLALDYHRAGQRTASSTSANQSEISSPR